MNAARIWPGGSAYGGWYSVAALSAPQAFARTLREIASMTVLPYRAVDQTLTDTCARALAGCGFEERRLSSRGSRDATSCVSASEPWCPTPSPLEWTFWPAHTACV